MKNCAVILAGGEGKRMKSDKPKTLSEVLGRPMLCWVMSALRKAGIDDICVVKGFKKECVEEYLSTLDFSVESVFQAERLGTGHAVMMAKDFLKKHSGNVVILNGDAPFMDSETIEDSLKAHIENGCAATVISAKVDDPTGYGRIVRDENGNLRAIVEQKDADEETLKINEVNSGGFWFDPNVLEANGIDSKVYSGYALGMGIERITNLKYRVNDLRLFSENDTRFLKEFEAAN